MNESSIMYRSRIDPSAIVTPPPVITSTTAGGGVALVKSSHTGLQLGHKTLTAGANITLTDSTDNVTIEAAGGGGSVMEVSAARTIDGSGATALANTTTAVPIVFLNARHDAGWAPNVVEYSAGLDTATSSWREFAWSGVASTLSFASHVVVDGTPSGADATAQLRVSINNGAAVAINETAITSGGASAPATATAFGQSVPSSDGSVATGYHTGVSVSPGDVVRFDLGVTTGADSVMGIEPRISGEAVQTFVRVTATPV